MTVIIGKNLIPLFPLILGQFSKVIALNVQSHFPATRATFTNEPLACNSKYLSTYFFLALKALLLTTTSGLLYPQTFPIFDKEDFKIKFKLLENFSDFVKSQK